MTLRSWYSFLIESYTMKIDNRYLIMIIIGLL